MGYRITAQSLPTKNKRVTLLFFLAVVIGLPAEHSFADVPVTEILANVSENYARLQAVCPSGTRVTGGGYYNSSLEGPPGDIHPIFDVFESRPFRTGGGAEMWLIGATNHGAEARDPGVLTAYAVCTKND